MDTVMGKSKTVDLLPCPRCGGAEIETGSIDGSWCWVKCSSCGIGIKGWRKRSELVAAWNRRNTPAEAAALRSLLARYGSRREVGRALADGTLTIVENGE